MSATHRRILTRKEKERLLEQVRELRRKQRRREQWTAFVLVGLFTTLAVSGMVILYAKLLIASP
jgi:hypothetical protein